MHKFIFTDKQKELIGIELINSIEGVILPNKIIMLKYDLLLNPKIIGDEIILGYTQNETTKNYLYVDVVNHSVNHKWNYSKVETYFLNSSIVLLEKSLNILDFYIDDLIVNQEFGEYHLFHEKYAIILERLLGKIDSKAISTGFWQSIIQEMKLGVI